LAAILLLLIDNIVPLVMGPSEARAESKVGQLNVPALVNQNVVGLDVPVGKKLFRMLRIWDDAFMLHPQWGK
jgi:hypothetical protein